ncbi:hypothetical protein UFOVP149_34 [uncultured Caudovirales phage]|uniref:Uncharacterized protein n=1 Tax=uncultured Caudovirales phage TaxID=2100421 RepID=A0A6J7WAS7_9CAUD|nr:hypothetical protein UFOVP149_34 [uncultured Caudovirales phage]
MTTPKLTVWHNSSTHEIILAQLSVHPEDGSDQEQIDHLATLYPYEGYTCVSSDYRGSVPEVDVDLWHWEDGRITATVPVPEIITPRQARLMLLKMNMLATVNQMMSTQDEATKIAWEYATEFRRDNPLLAALAKNIGMTDASLDQFFIGASTL